jgi:GNAT superfamily N-acetyltransferase
MQPMKFVRIGSVCVAEGFWRNGIGRKLVNLVQEWGIQGAKDVRLAVWTFNAPAVRLSEEMGFETRAFETGMPL